VGIVNRASTRNRVGGKLSYREFQGWRSIVKEDSTDGIRSVIIKSDRLPPSEILGDDLERRSNWKFQSSQFAIVLTESMFLSAE